MKVRILGAACAAALAASSANGQIVNLSVTGTVGFGLDSLGLFGPAGRSLRGSSYRMDFAYDISNAFDFGQSQQASGGTSFNRPSPIRRGDVTIDGITVSAIDAFSAVYIRSISPSSSQLSFGSNGPNGVNTAQFSWSRADQAIPVALGAPISRSLDSSDTIFSAFQRANQQLTVFTYLQLQPTAIAVSVANAVPEPATWALMIGGFGLAGGALRRSQRRVAYSIA